MIKFKGFTLVELLVAVALIGVLSAISYPSYLAFIKSTYRTTAENEMMAISYKMEKIKVKTFSYKPALDSDGSIRNFIHVGYTPSNGDVRYNFSINAEDNEYEIIGTPTERQGEDYGKLKLSFDGVQYTKKWDSNNDDTYSEDW